MFEAASPIARQRVDTAPPAFAGGTIGLGRTGRQRPQSFCTAERTVTEKEK